MFIAKDILDQLSRTVARKRTAWQVKTIDLTAATTDVDLVAAVANRRIFVLALDLVPAGATTLEIWSGPSTDTTRCVGGPGSIGGAASQQYVFGPFHTAADNKAVVLDRGSSVIVGGTIVYCLI